MSTLYGLVDTNSGNLLAAATTALSDNVAANVAAVTNVPVPPFVNSDPFLNKVHQYDSNTQTWSVIYK